MRPPEPLRDSPRRAYHLLLCRTRTTKNPTAATMNITVAATVSPSAKATTARVNAAMAPSCREREPHSYPPNILFHQGLSAPS